MYTKKEVQQNAIIDAKNNIPTRDDPNFSQFEQECMAMANNEARQVMAKYEPQLEILNGKHKPLLKEYERISRDYDAHSKKIERSEPSVELSRGKYYILMSLFVLGEVPMNSLAFSVFGESQIFTWVMALGVAVAIPWIAHAMGILIKRGSVPWWKNGIGVGALSLLTIGGHRLRSRQLPERPQRNGCGRQYRQQLIYRIRLCWPESGYISCSHSVLLFCS